MKEEAELSLLIVDDDDRIRELSEYAAHRSGLFRRISTATDGHGALEWLRAAPAEHRPSVILTDLSMPRLDGLDFVRQLQADPAWRDVPVVMFSSSNRPNDEALALEAGCRAFYPKPAGLEDLTRIMQALTEVAGKPAPAHH